MKYWPCTKINNHNVWVYKQVSNSAWFVICDSFIHWLSHPFFQNLPDTVSPKLKKLGSWHFERMFTPSMWYMSCAKCYMSHVMCHKSYVKCQVSQFFFFYKVLELLGEESVDNVGVPHPVFHHFVYFEVQSNWFPTPQLRNQSESLGDSSRG